MSTRKRWYDDEQIHSRRIRMRSLARDRIEKTAAKTITTAVSGIHLVRDCDLRATLEEKALGCNAFAKWTAFLNKRGTLVHLVPKDGDLHMRIPLYFSVAHLSDRRVQHLIWGIVEGRIA